MFLQCFQDKTIGAARERVFMTDQSVDDDVLGLLNIGITYDIISFKNYFTYKE